MLERDDLSSNRHRSSLPLEHDLFRKPVSSPDQVRAKLFRDLALELDNVASAGLATLEIHQVKRPVRLIHRFAGHLSGEGCLNDCSRQKPDGERRSHEQSLALELVQEAALEVTEIAHLRPEKEAGSNGAGNRARDYECGLVLPLRRPADVWVELVDANGFGLEQQVTGDEQLVRQQFLVGIKLELDAECILAIAARLGVTAPFRLGGDRQPEGKDPAIEDPVLRLGEEAVEGTVIPVVEIGNAANPVVGQKRSRRDREIVDDAVFEFALVLQRGEGPGPFAEPSDRIVFDFALAGPLGVCPFGEAEDVTRVDAGLASVAALAAFAAAARISAHIAPFSAAAFPAAKLSALATFAAAAGARLLLGFGAISCGLVRHGARREKAFRSAGAAFAAFSTFPSFAAGPANLSERHRTLGGAVRVRRLLRERRGGRSGKCNRADA